MSSVPFASRPSGCVVAVPLGCHHPAHAVRDHDQRLHTLQLRRALDAARKFPRPGPHIAPPVVTAGHDAVRLDASLQRMLAHQIHRLAVEIQPPLAPVRERRLHSRFDRRIDQRRRQRQMRREREAVTPDRLARGRLQSRTEYPRHKHQPHLPAQRLERPRMRHIQLLRHPQKLRHRRTVVRRIARKPIAELRVSGRRECKSESEQQLHRAHAGVLPGDSVDFA